MIRKPGIQRRRSRRSPGLDSGFVVSRVSLLLALAVFALPALTTAAENLPPEAVTERFAVPAGSRVRWGGVIVARQSSPAGTLLEVAGHPLDVGHRPLLEQPSGGHFMVLVPGSADSGYGPGAVATVTGILSGEISSSSGQSPRVLPLVRSQIRDLWPDRATRRIVSHPEPYPYSARGGGSLLPLVVPLAVAAALIADHGHVYIGSGFGRGGYRARHPWRHGHGGWRRHAYGGSRYASRIGFSAEFRL